MKLLQKAYTIRIAIASIVKREKIQKKQYVKNHKPSCKKVHGLEIWKKDCVDNSPLTSYTSLIIILGWGTKIYTLHSLNSSQFNFNKIANIMTTKIPSYQILTPRNKNDNFCSNQV